MSSDVPERPRKTLTLSVKPAPEAGGAKARGAAPDDGPRKRSGARARAVAQAVRAAPERDDAASETGGKDAARRTGPRGDAPRNKPYGDRAPGRGAPGRGASSGERPARSGSSGERAPYRGSGEGQSRGGPSAERSGPRPAYNRGEQPDRSDNTRTRDQRGAPSRPPVLDEHGQRVRRAPPAFGPGVSVDAGKPVIEESGPSYDVNVAAQYATTDHNERFPIFAPCPQGLEAALTAEMQALGFDDATPGRAGCAFTADWAGVQRANLYSRLATRILVQVAQAPMYQDDDVLELARATPWERWFGPEHTLRVDTSAIRSPAQSLQYCNLRAKDGICDRLRDMEGERPSIDTVRPDARVHLFLFENTATLYLDTSGESLFKRGWRLDKGEAPLRENLAAGMLALAGWDPEQALLDPFCGSGTLLIEAAWIALGIPPGIARPLGFERLRGHDAAPWEAIKEDAYSRIAPGLDAPIVGYDIDPAAIEFAHRNAERAWLADDAIRFEVRDARSAERFAEKGWIVTNPPYGDRLENNDPELWQAWSSTLKHQFGGWHLHVISSDMTFPQQLRLKPQRRTPIYNGGLECRLFGFELVEAGFRDV